MSMRGTMERVARVVEEDLTGEGLSISGTSSAGVDYESVTEMWLNEGERKGWYMWYDNAFNYWEDDGNCPGTLDGVLGGYGAVSPKDVVGSGAFLEKLRGLLPNLGSERAADCGAGIGRVTRDLLLPRFLEVDAIEQSPRLTAMIPRQLGRDDAYRCNCIVLGLQDFMPEPDTYDVIWVQWVVGHLHDVDFIKFLQRCRRGLRPNGVIVMKDNTFENDDDDDDECPEEQEQQQPRSCPEIGEEAAEQDTCCSSDCDSSAVVPKDVESGTGEGEGKVGLPAAAEEAVQRKASHCFKVDSEDSSVMRSIPYFKSLFRQAGVSIVLESVDTGLPTELHPVWMVAVK